MRNPRNEPLADESIDETGSRAARSAPTRRCVLTGRSGAREDMVRLALAPDGQVLPDALARAPGRGAWIGVTRRELEEAVAKGHLKAALSRGFKRGDVSVPDDLPERVEDALRRAFTDRLGIEWRSGNLLAGTDRITDALHSGRAAWLGHAADAGEDGTKKLDQALRVGREREGSDERGHRLPLDRMALSVALGRQNVVHLAMADRGAASRVQAQLARLLHFLGCGDPPFDAGSDSDEDRADRAA